MVEEAGWGYASSFVGGGGVEEERRICVAAANGRRAQNVLVRLAPEEMDAKEDIEPLFMFAKRGRQVRRALRDVWRVIVVIASSSVTRVGRLPLEGLVKY